MNNYADQWPATISQGDGVGLAKRGSGRESEWIDIDISNTTAAISSSLMTRYTQIHQHTHLVVRNRHVGAADQEGEWGNHEKSLWQTERQQERRASSNELLTFSVNELEETCLAAGLKNISLSFAHEGHFDASRVQVLYCLE